ncbi:MAG: hypothetical protein ABWJ97_00065 [Thermoproteus sp.]
MRTLMIIFSLYIKSPIVETGELGGKIRDENRRSLEGKYAKRHSFLLSHVCNISTTSRKARYSPQTGNKGGIHEGA